jgi:hypothetical protein
MGLAPRPLRLETGIGLESERAIARVVLQNEVQPAPEGVSEAHEVLAMCRGRKVRLKKRRAQIAASKRRQPL